MSPARRQVAVEGLLDLEPVYRAEFDNLVRALTLLAGSRDAAADAVQDAFVTASLRRDGLAGVASPAAWIRTVAARKLLDGHRRRTRWTRLVPSLARAQEAAVAPEVLAVDNDLLATVARLPHRQRAAVVLHYLADWSVDDVAQALGVAPGTVKSTLSDARASLRAHLQGGAVDV